MYRYSYDHTISRFHNKRLNPLLVVNTIPGARNFPQASNALWKSSNVFPPITALKIIRSNFKGVDQRSPWKLNLTFREINKCAQILATITISLWKTPVPNILRMIFPIPSCLHTNNILPVLSIISFSMPTSSPNGWAQLWSYALRRYSPLHVSMSTLKGTCKPHRRRGKQWPWVNTQWRVSSKLGGSVRSCKSVIKELNMNQLSVWVKKPLNIY